jgi:O-antigen/teichoic acid export membrane protein
MASTATRSSSTKILNNSFWYGLEQLLEVVLFFGTSVAVARYLGPEKLGYFSYINFFVMVVNRTGASGLAAATRKYMSEFIALDRPGTARSIYRLTFKYQLVGSISLSLLGVLGIALIGDPAYKLMAILLMLSIIPAALSWVPAMANLSFEDQSKNTISAFGYLFFYTTIVFLSIHFHWDLNGIAAAMLIGRTAEMILRIIPVEAKLRTFASEPIPPELTRRIHTFCLQAMAIQVLMSVVWDRSEMLFLRHYSSYEQIAFYSVSFGLVNNLLLAPRIFSGATNTTLMVECGRDPERVDSIVRNAARYMLLVVFPVHLGAAAVTSQAIRVVYGAKYLGAVPVLVVAALLAIPRAFQEIPDTLLRAADRQKQLFFWMAVTGVVNIALDFLLIPRYGAVGAAWGNGLAQAFGVVVIWIQARRFYNFSLPASTIRLFVAALVMAASAFFIARELHGKLALALPILVAIPIYVLLVKLLHGLDASDRVRLKPIGNRLPAPFRRAFDATLAFVTPAA